MNFHYIYLKEIAPERIRPICADDLITHYHSLIDPIDGAIVVVERVDKSSPDNNAYIHHTSKYNALLVEAIQNLDGFGTPVAERYPPIQGEISQVSFDN